MEDCWDHQDLRFMDNDPLLISPEAKWLEVEWLKIDLGDDLLLDFYLEPILLRGTARFCHMCKRKTLETQILNNELFQINFRSSTDFNHVTNVIIIITKFYYQFYYQLL